MRILITQSGENIFSEEEKREILDTATTNKIYQKKLTIEKYYNRKYKKNTEEKPAYRNYFIPSGISFKPENYFSKIFTDPNKDNEYSKYRKIRINKK